jgi:hypothetical protein
MLLRLYSQTHPLRLYSLTHPLRSYNQHLPHRSLQNPVVNRPAVLNIPAAHLQTSLFQSAAQRQPPIKTPVAKHQAVLSPLTILRQRVSHPPVAHLQAPNLQIANHQTANHQATLHPPPMHHQAGLSPIELPRQTVLHTAFHSAVPRLSICLRAMPHTPSIHHPVAHLVVCQQHFSVPLPLSSRPQQNVLR